MNFICHYDPCFQFLVISYANHSGKICPSWILRLFGYRSRTRRVDIFDLHRNYITNLWPFSGFDFRTDFFFFLRRWSMTVENFRSARSGGFRSRRIRVFFFFFFFPNTRYVYYSTRGSLRDDNAQEYSRTRSGHFAGYRHNVDASR